MTRLGMHKKTGTGTTEQVSKMANCRLRSAAQDSREALAHLSVMSLAPSACDEPGWQPLLKFEFMSPVSTECSS